MNLTDAEILELNDLCCGLVDGSLDESQKTRLSQMLETSPAARQFYVRALGLSASLCHYAGEMQSEEMDAVPVPEQNVVRAFAWGLGGLAIAASIALVVWFGFSGKTESLVASSAPEEFVARVTASKDCVWTGAVVQPNDSLARGQQIKISNGFVEITFDSGARVVLEGPASFEIDSAWDATLRQGTLSATVPPEAVGFTISNPSVEVVDLGTEFTMIAYASGGAEVLVQKGAVEATSRETADEQTIVLRENESRHFTSAGVSVVRDSEKKFARLSQTRALDRFVPATEYVHWSFDEAEGNIVHADAQGIKKEAYDARVEADITTDTAALRTEGQWQRALQFDGQRFAKAAFPGISGNTPRTVVFWVKVPADAPLSEAYAIVAWNTKSKKLNAHPVHINWNRNPVEGPVGVLRTDYGGGFALGSTQLRDGRWHHVAVVYAPGEDESSPVEVKQYVDGRLEGEGKPSPRGIRKTPPAKEIVESSMQNDVVWFGRRLGHERQRKDRFRGEIDELFIADRALAPREIVKLMKDNHSPPVELAATGKEAASSTTAH